MSETRHKTYKRERDKRHSIQQPPVTHTIIYLLTKSMDSFFALFTAFSKPETAPEPSTPIDADGGPGGDNGGGCIVA